MLSLNTSNRVGPSLRGTNVDKECTLMKVRSSLFDSIPSFLVYDHNAPWLGRRILRMRANDHHSLEYYHYHRVYFMS